MKYWLVKTEPETYGWQDLASKEEDVWDGVRNFQARNYLNNMLVGDAVYIYHSGKKKEIVGIAQVVSGPFPDPTDKEGKGWLSASIKADRLLPRPVGLKEIKEHDVLQEMLLVRQSRLSVMPLTKTEFEAVLKIAQG
ncbi:EVE domain-containing protein [Anditalea andensis]|uniref:Ubiquinol-cytochrome C reductase n=1 Tax=Anditalea andensis TaxID=1048983 RepID=A0A074LKU3_9BACT|nr:EVE domain-containing protein [Anditalea andensis]KEO74462.1 ubiquinol-cytochrome C reductase [Anditalea andensis]